MKAFKSQYDFAVNKICDWRSKYTQYEYPKKVIINMFYELAPTEILWNDVLKTYKKPFFGKRKVYFSDFNQAFKYIWEKHRATQLAVRSTLEKDLERNPFVGILDYRGYKKMASKAANGSSELIEEIEFSYIYNSLLNSRLQFFAAGGLMGWSESETYLKTCKVEICNTPLSSFESVMKAYNQEVGQYMQMLYKPI